MGMLIDGQWDPEDRPRSGSGGEFIRPQSSFRARIGDRYVLETLRQQGGVIGG